MTTAHTATPWAVEEGKIVSHVLPREKFGEHSQYSHAFIIAQPRLYTTPSAAESLANAEFIVRACNAHDDLARLAERVANLNEHAGEIGAGMLVQLVREARAAIAKAGIE